MNALIGNTKALIRDTAGEARDDVIVFDGCVVTACLSTEPRPRYDTGEVHVPQLAARLTRGERPRLAQARAGAA